MSTTTVPAETIAPDKRPHRQRKLTDALVLEYRRAYAEGRVTVAEIMRPHGMTSRSVYRMLCGLTWAHVGGPLTPVRPDRRGECNGRRKLTDALVLEYRRAYAEGRVTVAEIMQRHGMTSHSVCRMLRGLTWAHVGGPLTPVRPDRRGEKHPRAKYSRAKVEAILLELNEGNGSAQESAKQIADRAKQVAEHHKVPTRFVHDVWTNRTRKEASGRRRLPLPFPMRGKGHPGTILNNALVRLMRERHDQGRKGGAPVPVLVRDYGFSITTVWSVLTDPDCFPDAGGPIREKKRRVNVDEATRNEIRRAHAAGESGVSIARRLGRHPCTVYRIIKGPSRPGLQRGERHYRSTMSDAKRAEVLAGPAEGETIAAFARRLGESKSAVSMLLWRAKQRQPVPAVHKESPGHPDRSGRPEELVRLDGAGGQPEVDGVPVPLLNKKQYPVVHEVAKAGRGGLSRTELRALSGVGSAEKVLKSLCTKVAAWRAVGRCPDGDGRYRFRK
jgi:hypothetical protein